MRLADLAENVAVILPLSRLYLAVISRFAENRVAVNRETRKRTTTEGKHDPIHDSLPLRWLLPNERPQQANANGHVLKSALLVISRYAVTRGAVADTKISALPVISRYFLSNFYKIRENTNKLSAKSRPKVVFKLMF